MPNLEEFLDAPCSGNPDTLFAEAASIEEAAHAQAAQNRPFVALVLHELADIKLGRALELAA